MSAIIQKPLKCRNARCGASCCKAYAQACEGNPNKCPMFEYNPYIYKEIRLDEKAKTIDEIKEYMADYKVILPTTTEEWQRDMNIAYNQALEDFYNGLADELLWIKERFGDDAYMEARCSVGCLQNRLSH